MDGYINIIYQSRPVRGGRRSSKTLDYDYDYDYDYDCDCDYDYDYGYVYGYGYGTTDQRR